MVKDSGETANLAAIIAQVTGRPLPRNLSGKEWLAHQRQQGIYFVVFAAMLMVTTIAIVAIVMASSRPPDSPTPNHMTVRVRVRTADGEVVHSGTVTLGLSQIRTRNVESDGDAVFEEVPHTYRGRTVELRYSGPGYEDSAIDAELNDSVVKIIVEKLLAPCGSQPNCGRIDSGPKTDAMPQPKTEPRKVTRPARPRICRGEDATIVGKCHKCSFLVSDVPGKNVSHTAPRGGGLMHAAVLKFQCPMEPGARVRVSAGGDVAVMTQDLAKYGHWPRWIDMKLTGGRSGKREPCANGIKSEYDVEIPNDHKVSICGEWIVPPDGKQEATLSFERCKQGDAATTCRLESDWRIDFETL